MEGGTFQLVDDSSTIKASHTLPTILCCVCGVNIRPNPANMCMDCLQQQVDITEGIPREVIIHKCRGCGRYLRPPWTNASWESRELLALCLKKIPRLSKIKLVDAAFVWTPEESRRIRIQLTIQKEVLNNVKLQQSFTVHFIIQNQQCDECQRSYTEHTWKACVQVRQRVDHKKTFFYLEQLILKHSAHTNTINIEQVPEGVDFQFGSRSHALKFLEFLTSVIPCRYKSAKQLVSHDIHTSTYNYKFTFAVDIVPLCKDDLVVLPPKLAAVCGSIAPVALVYRVSNHIYLVDPCSVQTAEVTQDKFFRYPCKPIMTSRNLVEFTVLDVTPVMVEATPNSNASTVSETRSKRRVKRRYRGKLTTIREDEDAGDEADYIMAKLRAKTNQEMLDDSDSDNESHYANFAALNDDTGSVAVQSGAAASSTNRSRISRNMGMSAARSLMSVGLKSGASSVATTVAGGPRGKFLLADVEVARTKDLGLNDQRFIVRSHMGNILKPGDTVLGYDIAAANVNDEHVDESQDVFSNAKGRGKIKAKSKGKGGVYSKKVQLPNVVLVRKCYPRYRSKRTTREWQLKRLPMMTSRETKPKDGDLKRDEQDYEMFLRDIEEDRYVRASVDKYRNTKIKSTIPEAEEEDSDDNVEVDFPEIKMNEMMEEMTIDTTKQQTSSDQATATTLTEESDENVNA